MLRSALAFVFLALIALPLDGAMNAAFAFERDKRFFDQVGGQWTGPGEIVAGKYKGTKFVCNFDGETGKGRKIGMTLDGSCRVGVFTQPMKASVVREASGYRGAFLDGAAGKGLDVTGGRVRGNDVVFSLHRSSLSGAMRARLSGADTMDITISVDVEGKMVPVIGMKLKRTDNGAVGAIVRN